MFPAKEVLWFQEERLAGAVGCLVPLETAIQETIEYCRDRKAFGQSLLDNQYIHYRVVQRVMMGGSVTVILMCTWQLRFNTTRIAKSI